MSITWAELVDFWDPGQPRDSRGRWTEMGRAVAAYKGRHGRARKMLESGRASKATAEAALRETYGVDPEDAMPSVGRVSLHGLDDKRAVKVAKRLVDLNEKYPGAVISSISVADLHPEIGARVLMPKNLSGPAPVRLEFNSSINEDFGKNDHGQPSGFLNGTGIDYATTHEYAHIMHVNIVGDYNMKPRGKEKSRYREAAKWMEEYEQYSGRKMTPADMSEYSHDGGPMELVAESFADVEINGAAARPLSHYMHGRLVSAYNERASGQQALFAEADADLVELFYSPSQPRDANGRFARTGGGGPGGSPTRSYGSQREEFDGIRDHLHGVATDHELLAASDYADNWTACNFMNGHLRYGPPPKPNPQATKYAKRAEDLKSLIDKTPPLSTEAELYRGISYRPEDWGEPGSLLGKTIKDNGFISTTQREDVATQFATDSGEDNEGALMRIKTPAGTKVLPLSRVNTREANQNGEYVSTAPDDEFLLPPGTQFKVTKDTVGYFSKVRELDVEVITA